MYEMKIYNPNLCTCFFIIFSFFLLVFCIFLWFKELIEGLFEKFFKIKYNIYMVCKMNPLALRVLPQKLGEIN
jgi:hypothetical protein